jgi:glycosyltransferase involved in cell wall biosynthesis
MLGGGDIQAPDIYRVTLPFTFLNKHSTFSTGWISQDKALEAMVVEDRQEKLKGIYDLFGHDIVVLRRWLSPGAIEDAGANIRSDIKMFSKQITGKEALVVYESDDDYSGRYRPADVTLNTWTHIISAADAVIASTDPLGALMAEEAGLETHYVAKNYIHYKMFSETSLKTERESHDKIVVMLAGTSTHDEDWRVVADVMPKIMEKHSNVVFKVAGNVPDYLYGKCEFVPPVHYSHYPSVLRQADILCCALDPEDRFNDSKSYIKAIEGWSAAREVGERVGGCAVVASKALPYKGVVHNLYSGLTVEHTHEAWKEAIEMLIEDRQLREKVQVNGYRQAKAYDIALRWKDWAGVFRKILADRPG